jgi:hypothetical protein
MNRIMNRHERTVPKGQRPQICSHTLSTPGPGVSLGSESREKRPILIFILGKTKPDIPARSHGPLRTPPKIPRLDLTPNSLKPPGYLSGKAPVLPQSAVGDESDSDSWGSSCSDSTLM